MIKELIDHNWVRFQCEECCNIENNSSSPCVLFQEKGLEIPHSCPLGEGDPKAHWIEVE